MLKSLIKFKISLENINKPRRIDFHVGGELNQGGFIILNLIEKGIFC